MISSNSWPKTAEPMTILIGADTFPPDVNGSARFSERLAACLVARGHRVHVMAPAFKKGGHGTFTETHAGCEMTVHRLYSWRWRAHEWLRFALPWRIRRNSARIIRAVKPDVIHFQSHFVVGRGLSIEGKKRGIGLVGTNHFMPDNLKDFSLIPTFLLGLAIRITWRLAARCFARADVVTSPTRRAADFLERNTRIRHVLDVSCGIDLREYVPNLEPKSSPLILFVGRVTGEKRLDVLLRAFALLAPELKAKLEIVGSGDQLGLLKLLAKRLGIEERVCFTGYVSDEELRSIYTNATVFVMPSVAELQSIATMEAMASGLPVVAANAMALPHLVREGKNGYLFEPDNVSQLTQRLDAVLRLGSERLVAMQKESLKIVSRHDIHKTLEEFETIYRKVV